MSTWKEIVNGVRQEAKQQGPRAEAELATLRRHFRRQARRAARRHELARVAGKHHGHAGLGTGTST
jgi:hypothetical protein